MNAIRPLDDSSLQPDELPKMRARWDDDEPQAVDDAHFRGEEYPDGTVDEGVASAAVADETIRKPVAKLLGAMLILIAVTAAGAWLLQPHTLPIQQVRIEGEFRQLSQEDLQATVLAHLRGGFFSMNVSEVHDAVRDNPWVREVWVQRVWPDTLQVSVREQVPAARWNNTGLISTTGEYFVPDAARLPADLPRLIGPDGTQEQMAAKLKIARELLLPLQLEVQQLVLSERRAWSFVTASGLEVVLGRKDFEQRLQRFVELVPASLGERLGEAVYVDMRYTNGFAVQFHESGAKPAEGEGAV